MTEPDYDALTEELFDALESGPNQSLSYLAPHWTETLRKVYAMGRAAGPVSPTGSKE